VEPLLPHTHTCVCVQCGTVSMCVALLQLVLRALAPPTWAAWVELVACVHVYITDCGVHHLWSVIQDFVGRAGGGMRINEWSVHAQYRCRRERRCWRGARVDALAVEGKCCLCTLMRWTIFVRTWSMVVPRSLRS